MSAKQIFACCIVAAAVIFGCWFVPRVDKYGLDNAFSREQRFVDDRPLTEEVAIELTKKTLALDGHDTSVLAPQEYDNAAVKSEPFFARNTIDPNTGYVLWGPPANKDPSGDQGGQWSVSIAKDGSEVRCRALRPK